VRRALSFVVIVIALVAVTQSVATSNDDFVPPDDFPTGWYARIETSAGRILAMLHPDQAPQSVAHFAGLAEGTLEWTDPATGQSQKAPYYDGIQVSFAKGGHLFEVGYRHGTSEVPPLWVPNEGKSPRGFGDRAGRLGMTTSGAGISGVVFFITASTNRRLDGKYPCFGTVVSDIDTVYRISEVKTHANGRPIEPVTIEKIRIFSVGNPPPIPDPVPYVPSRVPMTEREPGR
jgi:peptidyl-prolyl cis-trans isomerase A (cyclophilin A)